MDIIYEIELQSQWEDEKYTPSDYELLQTYPEAKDFYRQEMEILKDISAKLEKIIFTFYERITRSGKSELAKWYRQKIVNEFYLKDLIAYRKRINYLDQLLNPIAKESEITDRDIEQARKNPKIDLWELARANSRKFVLCPFHKEASASMSFYKAKDGVQRYNCFGCGERGDILDFVMKTRNIDFIAAVKNLI